MLPWIIFIIAVIFIDIAILIWWKSTHRNVRLFGFINYVDIKENTNLNLFGMIFIGTILNVLFAPVSLVYWLYKLCTWHPKKRERIFNG